ncbi:MAG: flagellar hook-length control protein FliK [Pseudomonadota bacterium]
MDIQMMLAAQTGKPAPKTQGGASVDGQFAQNLANAGRHSGNDLAKLANAGQQTGADLAQLAKQAKAQLQASTDPQQGKAGPANALAAALAAHGLSSASAEALQAELPETQADLEAIRQRIEAVMAERGTVRQPDEAQAAPLPDATLSEALAELIDEGTLDKATAEAIEAAVQRDDASPQTADETTVAALQQALAALANDARHTRTTSAGERTGDARAASTATSSTPQPQRADGASVEALLSGQRRDMPGVDSSGLRPVAQPLDAKAIEAAIMTERQSAAPLGAGGEGGRALANEAAAALAGGTANAQSNTTFAQAMTSANATGTGGMPSQATLSAPVQSPAWPGQLGQQLVQFARQGGGEQHIEMRLHPAELGPLSVTLKMTEQGAQAQFLSAHAQVRQAIEQALPQLRDALAEQGIDLSETSVGEQRQQESQTFAGNEGGHGQAGAELSTDGTAGDGMPASDGMASEVTLDGRVNLYA